MQVYEELRILTARPDKADEAKTRHLLYGFVPAAEVFNTKRWLDLIAHLLGELEDDQLPIIVGGTGLYFKALTEGFASVPEIPDAVRLALRDAFFAEGAEAMHRRLQAVDSVAACELRPSDGQRILRALEVVEATGKSILYWQRQAQSAPLLQPEECRKIIALPERDILYARINARFDAMVNNGALEEVERLAKLGLDRDLPAMRAIGVPQLMSHLAGEMTLEDAISSAKQESRRYAKRQMTWLRNQMDETWRRVNAAESFKN